MEKVEMIVSGRRALVPANKAKLIQRKQDLVAQAIEIRNRGNEMSAAEHLRLTSEICEKIIRLNRRIGPCVQFIR